MAQLQIDRLAMGSAEKSAATLLTAQRQLTVADANAICRELSDFYNFVEGLRVFAGEYRAGGSSLLGTSTVAMFAIGYAAGKSVNIAPGFSIYNGQLAGGHYSAPFKWAPAEAIGEFQLRAGSTVLVKHKLRGLQVLPFLYNLPFYLVRVCGAFLDELASSLLRSYTNGLVLSEGQRVAINRIASGQLEEVVRELASTPVAYGSSIWVSAEKVAAKQLASDDAILIMKSRFPTLYRSLVMHQAVGTAVVA